MFGIKNPIGKSARAISKATKTVAKTSVKVAKETGNIVESGTKAVTGKK